MSSKNSLSDRIIRIVRNEAIAYNITHYFRGEIQTFIEATFNKDISPWMSHFIYSSRDVTTIYIAIRKESPIIKVSHDVGMGAAIKSEDFLRILISPHRDSQINSIIDE